MSIRRWGAMEAKCLAIAHAELGGIPLPCTELHTPSAASPRGPHDNVKFNMMSSPPADRAHLACQEESGACATVLCDMQHGKDVVAVKRVRIGGRWGARIGNPQSGTVQICHSSYHFLTVRALGGRSAQLDLVDRNSLSPARCRLGPFTRHSLGSSQRPAHVTPAYPATVLITVLRIRSA